MQCVDWTPEYLDGLIIIALLKANDLDAHLFGENFVRQNWFHILAYDGFRVMVPNHQVGDAFEIIDGYRRGVFDLPAEVSEHAVCPECGDSTSESDLSLRRWVFLTYLSVTLGFAPFIFFLWRSSEHVIAPSVALMIVLAFSLPALVRHMVVGRYRCTSCATTWRALPDQTFHQQQDLAHAALEALPK